MLVDTYDEDAFFDPDHMYSGVAAIQRVVDGMTLQEQQQFVALHSRQRNIQSIVQHNAFSDYDTDPNGHELVTLRLYNNISRANNSCRPNSVYSHNPETRCGVLRAVRNIANSEEITVEYQCSEDDSLREASDRETVFRTHYGFRCDCPACRGRQRREDSRRRVRACQLLAEIATERSNIPDDHGAEIDRAARLAIDDEYITTLHDLEICDFKLAAAYKYRAEVHMRGFKLAERDGHTHCITCQHEDTPWTHLRLARDDFLAADRLYEICYGPNHPECLKMRERFDEIRYLMIVTPLPSRQ